MICSFYFYRVSTADIRSTSRQRGCLHYTWQPWMLNVSSGKRWGKFINAYISEMPNMNSLVGIVASFLTFHLYDPGLNHMWGTTWIGFSVPPRLCGFSWNSFPPTSKTETSPGSWLVQWLSLLYWESWASQPE